jgi:GTP-binding protein
VSARESTKEVRIATAEFAAAASKPDQVPKPGAPEIAFAGRSNVGKSSVLNMLLARKGLARTSNTPGRTRQINFFDVKVAGGPELSFVDLPGYGYAKVSKAESASWRGLMESYLQNRATLRAVVLLVDIRRGVEDEERDLLEFLALRPELVVLLAATKIDKISRSAQKPALTTLGREAGVRIVGTSAETRAGREELWARILETLT